MKEPSDMKTLAQIDNYRRPENSVSARPNWLFEIEPYSVDQGSSLQELRDTLRLKKALKQAVESDVASIRLIEAIRAGIRA